MEAVNRIKLHVEQDGTITVDTDAFEDEAHLDAENFIKEVFELAGGEQKIIEHKNPDQHTHVHLDGHAHAHH